MHPRAPIALLVAAAATLGGAATAQAAVSTLRDDQGRPITFDVRAAGADVPGYARVLSRAVHGDEITGLTVRVASARRIAALCRDNRSVACYSRGRGGAVITIPARSASRVQAALLHEYGHHIDATVSTPRWWAARRIDQRLRAGQLARDYSMGWSRSVGEVFAEDYVALHVRGVSAIRWLPRPSQSVLRALRRDITGDPGGLPPQSPEPATDPTVPVGGAVLSRDLRTGVVGRGAVIESSVALDAPGRYVTAAVRPDPARGEVPVDIAMTCEGAAPAQHRAGAGGTAYVQFGPVGPGTCTVRVSGPPDRTGGVTVEMVVGTAASALPGVR